MSISPFPFFKSFEEAIRFIIENVVLETQQDGTLLLSGPVYDPKHGLPTLTGNQLPLNEKDLEALAEYLRLNFYVNPFNPNGNGALGIDFNSIRGFDARTASLWQDAYWMAKMGVLLGEGSAVFSKGSRYIAITSGSWLFDGDWKVGDDDPEEQVNSIYYPKQGEDMQANSGLAGFEFANGHALSESDKGQIIRFYLNFGPDWNAIRNFSQDVFDYLELRGVPYSIKVLGQKESFIRADSVILYSEQRYFFIVKLFLESVYLKYKPSLRFPVPIFTAKMADGLGFAEEPDTLTPQSVGTHRSELLAGMLARLAFENIPTAQRIDRGIAIMKEQYPDLTEFHLNPGSDFPYSFDTSTDTPVLLKQNNYRNFFLEGAVRVGYRLCKEAVWLDENRCNWLTYLDNTGRTGKYGFLDDGFNSGLAGIKLFLKTLNDHAPDAVFKKVLSGLKDVKIISPPYADEKANGRKYFKRKAPFHFYTNTKKYRFEQISLDLIDKQTFDGISKGALVYRWITNEDADLARQMNKTHFLEKERPFINGFNRDFFCPTIRHGYAGIGYFFLRVYYPSEVKALSFD